MIGTTRRVIGDVARVVRSPIWAEIASPVTRSAGWYLHTARRSRGLVGGNATAIPDVVPDLALTAQAAIDEMILTIARLTHRPRPPEEMARIESEVATALRLYERMGWLDDPASYHREPPPPEAATIRPARALSLRYEVLSFESGYAPHPAEPGRERYLADTHNATAYAWILRHPEPRPWLVCVHGAGMGQPIADLHVFRAAWLHHTLGLNVALPIQARHGPRRAGLPFGVGFPADDMMDNVHAVAHSVWDIRRVIAWIRTQSGENVGTQGLSLGGYTTALLAGLDEDLACVIVGVPAIDFADLMERHAPARFRSRPEYEHIGRLTRQAMHVVSPLSIPPKVPLGRRFIYAGLADRLVHPVRQVQALWTHWDEPAITWFRGSHIGFFLSRPVHEFLAEALSRSGLVHPDETRA